MTAVAVDPLAQFADRDQAVRDRIDTIHHRSYTHPSYYPSSLAEATDRVDALRARYELVIEMKGYVDLHVCSVHLHAVLCRLLGEVCVLALMDLQEAEKRLARLQS